MEDQVSNMTGTIHEHNLLLNIYVLQMEKLHEMKIQCVAMNSSTQSDVESVHNAVESNQLDVLISSPEFASTSAFKELARGCLRRVLCLVAFDEAHVITEWGNEEFRPEYGHMAELLSVLQSPVEVLLSATMGLKTLKMLQESLCIEHLEIVAESPDRPEIFLDVDRTTKPNARLDWLIEDLYEKREAMEKTLVYVRSINQCTRIFERFLKKFDGILSSTNGNEPDSRLVEMFSSVICNETKTRVLQRFLSDSSLRIVICTVAFGMGINIPDIRNVVCLGLPESVTHLWQQIGRACRDGKAGRAIIYPSCVGNLRTTDEIKEIFRKQNTGCIREAILQTMWLVEMGELTLSVEPCCSVCSAMDIDNQ